MPVDRETLDELVTAIINDSRFIGAVKEMHKKQKPMVEVKTNTKRTRYVLINHVLDVIYQKDLLLLFKELLIQKPVVEPDFYPSGLIKNALGIQTIKFDDALLIAAVSLMDFIRPNFDLEDDGYGNYYFPFQRIRESKGMRRKCITLPRLPFYQYLIRESLDELLLDIEEYRNTRTLVRPYRLDPHEPEPDILRYMNFLDFAQQLSKEELLKIRKKLK